MYRVLDCQEAKKIAIEYMDISRSFSFFLVYLHLFNDQVFNDDRMDLNV